MRSRFFWSIDTGRAPQFAVCFFVVALVSSLFAGCVSAPEKETPITVLFIGSSYTYVNDLPGTFGKIAASKGKKVKTEESTASQYHLSKHLKTEETLSKIDARKWDYVIANENYLVLIDAENYEKELYPAVSRLVELLRSKGMTLNLMINSANKNGLPLEGIDTYDSMQDRIIGTTESMASAYGFSLIPMGLAWRTIRRMYPGIELWAYDCLHPNAYGTYLNACIVYAYIFGESPEGSSYRLQGVTRENAKILQKVAYETVVAYKSGK